MINLIHFGKCLRVLSIAKKWFSTSQELRCASLFKIMGFAIFWERWGKPIRYPNISIVLSHFYQLHLRVTAATISFCRISPYSFEAMITVHYTLSPTSRTGSVTHRSREGPHPWDDLANTYPCCLDTIVSGFHEFNPGDLVNPTLDHVFTYILCFPMWLSHHYMILYHLQAVSRMFFSTCLIGKLLMLHDPRAASSSAMPSPGA